MMSLFVLMSLAAATFGAWLIASSRRSISAYGLLLLSIALLFASQPAIKAVFTWLALVGIAGFAATIARGAFLGRDSTE